jgi:hypothetical protein
MDVLAALLPPVVVGGAFIALMVSLFRGTSSKRNQE